MKLNTKILIKCFLATIYLINLTSCCDKENGSFYFPHEAINYYNKYDTILFQDTISGIQEIHVICKRDTGLSVFEWGGWCGYEDYNYSKIYFLTKDSCLNFPYLIINISPDTIIEIILVPLDGHNVFYNSNFPLSPKKIVKLSGFVYDNIVTIESHGLFDGPPILFNLKYGIIQYRSDTNTFNLINYEL